MFSHISWGSYCTVLFILVLIYYGYLAWANRGDWFVHRMTTEPPGLDNAGDQLFPQADACSQELHAYLGQSSQNKRSKNELVFGIHQVLKKYPALPGSGYQQAISRMIEFTAKDKCALHLSEEDRRQVWLV